MTDGWREPCPDLVVPNPAHPDDPLGESVLDPGQPWLRVFEPRDLRVVIGRFQDPAVEADLEVLRQDGIPLHRRCTGGGAVVLAPGMVVIGLRLVQRQPGIELALDRILPVLGLAVQTVTGQLPLRRGLGDLALPAGNGPPRKILGASLRFSRGHCYYLGVFLVDDAVPLMQRYLRTPSRMPDYRQGRSHAAFCDHLGRYGAATGALAAALRQGCQDRLERFCLHQAGHL